jgi:PAS domain S-box-containing protein
MSISIPMVGEVVVFVLATVVFIFEGWLYRHRRRPENFWIAAMALEVAALAAAMVVHMATTSADAALLLTRFEAVTINLMVHSMLAFVEAIAARPLPGPRRWVTKSAVLWAVLLASPLVVTDVAPQTMAFLPTPFLRRVMNPQLLVFHVVGFALIVLSSVWLYRHRERRPRVSKFFLVGIALWTVMALISAVRIGVAGSPYPGGMFEYGFCLFTICLVLADATNYVLLLDASETAVRDAESSERAALLLHEQVVESVSEGIVLLDETGSVQLWNSAMSVFSATPREHALARPLHESLVVSVPERRRLDDWLASVRLGGVRSPLHLDIDPGGGGRHVECIASPFAWMGSWSGSTLIVIRDLTELERAHEREAQSATGFLAVVDSTPDPIAICSDDVLVHVNRALVDCLGYLNADELIGRRYSAIVGDQSAERRSSSDGPRETKWIQADGAARHVEVVTLAIEFDGRPANILVCRDLTEARALSARAMGLDRMIAVGTLAAGVGHEINNPLAYLLLSLQEAMTKLRAGALEPNEGLKLLAEAEDATKRIATIVASLRSLSRHDETMENLALADTVRAAATTTAHQANHRSTVSLRIGSEASVFANEARLTQVFVNLIMNAVQALPEGRHDNKIDVHVFEESVDRSPWIVAEVADNGCGIAPSTAARVFDPFFTTKPAGVGTGLGLSICHETVTKAGGRMEVSSQVGVGTTLRVMLPVAEEIPVSMRRPSVSQPGDFSVLVVDDERVLLNAIRRVLSAHATVAVAEGGRQALDLLETGLRPDVILADLMMPGMSGMKLFSEVKIRFPELADRVLFMSGGAFSPESRSFCTEMARRVLTKPIPLNVLTQRVVDWARRAPRDHDQTTDEVL